MDKTPKQAPNTRYGPKVVTDEMREEYRFIGEEDLVVLETEHTHGSGYGVAPYGYKLTHLKSLVKLEDECPSDHCNNDTGIYEYNAGRATCSPCSVTITCNHCGTTISEEFHD